MPSSRAIKYKDNVTPRLALLPVNTRIALESGVIESMTVATKTMKTRVTKAVTKTGELRVSGGTPRGRVRPAWYEGRGPGRIESGRMINSIRWQAQTTTSGVRGTAGFINAPRYTALQELGSTGRGAVPPMLAFAAGHTSMAARFGPVTDKFVERGVRYAQMGRRLANRDLSG